MRVFRRADLMKKLKLTFICEVGVDDGGPCREYLRLVIAAMAELNHLLDV